VAGRFLPDLKKLTLYGSRPRHQAVKFSEDRPFVASRLFSGISRTAMSDPLEGVRQT
jgi:hypothetical protein